MKTLIIDNYDSFTWNLYQYLAELGANPVVRTNTITLQEIEKINPTHLVLSPGPGTVTKEKDFGICHKAIQKYLGKIPILGVCLGHQGIVHFFGGKIIKAPKIMHGKQSLVTHQTAAPLASARSAPAPHATPPSLFHNIPSPFPAMRYHSLCADTESFPSQLKVTAWTKDGTIMAVQHCQYPLFGVQFHPESIGTPDGKQILSNFLAV